MANGCTPPVNLNTQAIVATLLHDTESKYDGHNILTPLDDINASTRLSSELLAKLTDYFLNDRGTPNADLQKLYSFLTVKVTYLQNRQIFITVNRSLGIGSAWIKPGDIVAVFHGAEVPFVLREDCASLSSSKDNLRLSNATDPFDARRLVLRLRPLLEPRLLTTSSPTPDPSWSSISTEFLRAELARRDDGTTKPECGSGIKGSYNTSAHVGALILILVLSTLACGFPLISRRSSKTSTAGRFIFISQHFGTGVLIATAFVHLLPTAFVSLTDPCLPYFFSEGYHPLAGLIAMFSALVVVGLEMFLTTRGAGHSHSHGGAWDELPGEEGYDHSNGSAKPRKHASNGRLGKLGLNHRPNDIALEDLDASEGLVGGVSPLPASTPEMKPQAEPNKYRDDNNDNESDLDLDELDPTTQQFNAPDAEVPHQHKNLSPEEERKRQILQCLLLEAGILFHSIFIGMAVSVATGPPFVVFLIAIAFHQSFEGLALGSRIAAINFPPHSPRPWLMVLAYGTTTPIGQAIGLIVHNLYDPQSAAGLLMVGFMNGISSGLLLFAGLVQLLAEDFLSDKSYGILKGRRRWEAFTAVIGGAMLMALVGAWA
ncbi:hypothetical protein G7Y89_g6321 [Cudoniella acicularis]|uniref:Uncharacterized protein n=1 Tax=Cudoniella acicularis TaxID=354080 RepID=A0A8H4W2J4_9HELO|nr:hypothetical protein G7Y89_g6321 [Cudoniella acicularis]